jgi:hypothetical protein
MPHPEAECVRCFNEHAIDEESLLPVPQAGRVQCAEISH